MLFAFVSFQIDVSAGTAQHAPFTITAGEGVDPADVELIRESIALAESTFATTLDAKVGRPLTVIVQPGESDRGETYGIYRDDVIEFFTGSQAWSTRSNLERMKGILHEYAHYYLDPTPHLNQRPVWLEEGLAEFLAWRLLDESGLADHTEILAFHAAHIRIWPTGAQLCSLTPITMSGVAYPLVHLGAAALVENLDLSAIGDYRDSMAQGAPHSEAFETAFQRSEAEFCADAEHAIGAFPPSVSTPNDLFMPASPVSGTYAAFVSAPRSVQPGAQVIVRARTDESAECALSLYGPSSPEPITTTRGLADGEGDVFWLITLPLDSASGNGRWFVSCGEGEDESPVTIALRRIRLNQ